MPVPRFRVTVWDPWLILSQIAALQSLQYAAVSVAVLFVHALVGSRQPAKLAYLFDYRELRGDTGLGWALAAGWFAGSAAGILVLLYLVQRAKLCLDFSLTFHFIHLVATTFYSRGVPNTLMWWAVQFGTCACMTLAGERACMRRELAPIDLSGGSVPDPRSPSPGRRAGAGGAAGTPPVVAAAAAGWRKQRGSEYEMLPMHEPRPQE